MRIADAPCPCLAYPVPPVDRRLVDHKLLNSDELRWLTDHNESVRRTLLPLIKHDRRAVKYLQKQ